MNWENEGIKLLYNRYGLDLPNAKRVYRVVYQQLYRQLRKETGRKSSFNVRHAAYQAINTGNIADVKLSNDAINVKTKLNYTGQDIEKNLIADRFRGFANSYEEVNVLLQQYLSGKISFKEFNKKISHFKKTNIHYIRHDGSF